MFNLSPLSGFKQRRIFIDCKGPPLECDSRCLQPETRALPLQHDLTLAILKSQPSGYVFYKAYISLQSKCIPYIVHGVDRGFRLLVYYIVYMFRETLKGLRIVLRLRTFPTKKIFPFSKYRRICPAGWNFRT